MLGCPRCFLALLGRHSCAWMFQLFSFPGETFLLATFLLCSMVAMLAWGGWACCPFLCHGMSPIGKWRCRGGWACCPRISCGMSPIGKWFCLFRTASHTVSDSLEECSASLSSLVLRAGDGRLCDALARVDLAWMVLSDMGHTSGVHYS